MTLLERAASRTNSHQPEGSFLIEPKEVYQEYVDILAGKVYYNSRGEDAGHPTLRTSHEDMRLFVERSVAPALLRVFCVRSHGAIDSVQNLSGPGLTSHLYGYSRWIENYLTFAKEPSGHIPEIKLGEWSRLFSKEEARTFNQKLVRMALPNDPDVGKEFNNLRALIRAGSAIDGLGLLLCVF